MPSKNKKDVESNRKEKYEKPQIEPYGVNEVIFVSAKKAPQWVIG